MEERRFLHLSGLGAREGEIEVAAYIEASLAFYDGRDLGPRTRRDGAGGLRVDFTYDLAAPPAALEVTALVDPDVRALDAALRKLERELHEIVQMEQLGTWLVGLRIGTVARGVGAELIEFLRENRGAQAMLLLEGDLPNELSELGVVSLLRLEDDHSECSLWPPIANDVAEAGFAELLEGAIAENADKLAESRPRETHLVVSLDRGGLSGDPDLTPAPSLPEAIDVLWVALGYYIAKYSHRLWRTKGDRTWELLRHPLGDPPVRFHPSGLDPAQ